MSTLKTVISELQYKQNSQVILLRPAVAACIIDHVVNRVAARVPLDAVNGTVRVKPMLFTTVGTYGSGSRAAGCAQACDDACCGNSLRHAC